MDMLLVVLALIGVFFMVNMAVGTTKKAKAVARKRTRTIKIQQPVLSRMDKLMGRAGYMEFSRVFIDRNDGQHEYLAKNHADHLVLVYEIISYDNEEFDLVLVNQGEYVNV